MKKSILIIDNSTGWTGAFKSIATVTQHLSSKFEFHFCIPVSSSNETHLKEKQISVLTLKFIEISKRWNTLFYLPRLLSNAIKLKSYCKKNNITVIHVNDLYNLLGVVLKIISPGLNVVYHVRLLETSYARRFYKLWIKIISRYADAIVAVSEAAKHDSEKHTKRKIEVIYDCIETLPVSTHKKNSEVITFFYLANYVPGKGHEHAIKAFSEAYKQNRLIKLILSGGTLGNKKNELFKTQLNAMVSQLALSEVVTLGDFESNVQHAIEQCDVFLNFSESESFSMTCLEAITAGTPVIATNSGGPAEIVTHNYCGIIIPVGDVSAATEAMLQLAADAYKRDYFGNNAVQQAREKFNLGREAGKLSKLYEA